MSNDLLKLAYTWDYRMRWAPGDRPLERGMGGRSYTDGAETFIEDYSRAFEWFGRHGYDGVLIWGFLRDSHGGVDAARELCRRAAGAGVKVIAGVGVNCYSGVYWEGDNPYNLQNWITRHPELAARGRFRDWFADAQAAGADPPPRRMICASSDGGGSVLCPSKKENVQWLKDGLSWLLDEVPVDGLWYEVGDYGMCCCDECKDRIGHTEPYSLDAMVDVVPAVMQHVRGIREDLQQLTLYYGNMPYYLGLDLGILEKYLPDLAWCVWRLGDWPGWASVAQEPWQSVVGDAQDVRSVTGRDIAFFPYSSFAGHDEDLMAVERIHTACRTICEKGLNGFMMMGELRTPSALANYIAADFFLANPTASVWDGLAHVLDTIRKEGTGAPGA